MGSKALLIAANETKVHSYVDKPLNKTVTLTTCDVETLSEQYAASEKIRQGFGKLFTPSHKKGIKCCPKISKQTLTSIYNGFRGEGLE